MAPGSIAVVAGSNGVANGTVTLTVPSTAASGSDVTLTIEAQNTANTETNYVVLRFSVTAKVQLPEDMLSLEKLLNEKSSFVYVTLGIVSKTLPCHKMSCLFSSLHLHKRKGRYSFIWYVAPPIAIPARSVW